MKPYRFSFVPHGRFPAFRRAVPSLVLAALLTAAGGCSTPSTAPPAAETTARLTFADMAPLPVVVGAVQVVREYDPMNDPAGGAYYPVLPDQALRNYAEARFRPVGPSHILKFVIADASVRHKLENSGHKVGDWLGVGRSEMYEISIVLRLYTETAPGANDGTPPATLTFLRSTHIPADYSIEQREAEQLRFLDTFIRDIDRAVTDMLQQKMRLAGRFLSPADGIYEPVPAYMLADDPSAASSGHYEAQAVPAYAETFTPASAPALSAAAVSSSPLSPLPSAASVGDAGNDGRAPEPDRLAAAGHGGEGGDGRLVLLHTLLTAPATMGDTAQP